MDLTNATRRIDPFRQILESVASGVFSILHAVTVPATDTTTARRGENALLPRLAAGEDGVPSLVLDRYGGLVWSLARRLCETHADAEDAVQDIFLDIWKSSGRFDPSVASEATFIATIARRRLIDRRRKVGRAPKREGMVEETVDDPQMAEPGTGSATSEEAQSVQHAMGELSEEQRRVLRLSVVHGLSHQSIAEATGLPLGTVKTHARRGLIRIRKVLARDRGNEQQTTPANDPTPADGPGEGQVTP
jgi:RNA polymerase sigma-70 factor (ECF subfamily)